jgi:hypothetical protein
MARGASIFLILAGLVIQARASIFILAICKDGVVAVADSRFAFVDNTSKTQKPLAYADGLSKIIRLDSALMVETGQGFIGNERFDQFVRRFSAAPIPPLEVDEILPTLIQFGNQTLPPVVAGMLRKQHLAVAKFEDGDAVICGYDGKMRPCIDQGYVQSSPTDFAKLLDKLPKMSSIEVAYAARASMRRYITAEGKQTTMGGEFSAMVLTRNGFRDLWTLKNPLQARTVDELNALVQSRKIPVTLVPPATWADLKELLDSGPAQ